MGKQIELLAHEDEAFADIADARAVVMTEVGYGLEVWRQSLGEPHQFNIALRFTFQSATGLDSVQITVDVYLEE